MTDIDEIDRTQTRRSFKMSGDNDRSSVINGFQDFPSINPSGKINEQLGVT